MRKEDSIYWVGKMPDAWSMATKYYADWTDDECTTDNIADAMREYTEKVLAVLADRLAISVGEEDNVMVAEIIEDTINNLK